MKKEIKTYEEISMNAHPALNIMHYDGWILRFADSYSGRANSVNMLYPSTLPDKDKVDFCETMYQNHNLPAIFKLTDGMEDFDMLLERRGYEIVTPTQMMLWSIDDSATACADVMIEEKISSFWQDGYFRLVGINPEDIDAAKQIQNNICNKTLCATITDKNGKIIACGLSVVERTYAGLFDIVVSEEHRRKGYGLQICMSLIAQAKELGAKTMYLQVLKDNPPAIRMYEKIGFTHLYDYWYRVK